MLVGVAVEVPVGVGLGLGVAAGVWEGVEVGAGASSTTFRVSEKPMTSLTKMLRAPEAMSRKTCVRMPSE